IKDQLGPLRTTRILQGNDTQSRFLQNGREFFHALIRSTGRLKRTCPKIAVELEARMSRRHQVCSHGCGSANHVGSVLGDDLFIAQPVLYRADDARVTEYMGCLLNRHARMQALGGEDSEITSRKILRFGSNVERNAQSSSAADLQPVLAN